MTQANLGTARIDILIDTASMNAGISEAKSRVSSMGAEFEARFEKMSQAEKRATLEVLKFNDSLGRTREEMKLLNAGARGAAPEALEQLRASLLKQRQEMDAGGISAKAYTAAMRGVPAQLTDIAVSLQGGQQPLTVLLQQGGQLKDMFGGVVPAAKALGSSLLGLVNPYTVTAAAAVALAVAWSKGQDEAEEFARVLAETGSVAGVTADQMIAMSEALAGSNLTQGKAAEALTEVAKSGKIASTSFVAVASAAANMEDATGRAIAETVAEFTKLGQDPVTAIAKLNEQHNFLTEATYSQIKALQEQGRTQEAASLATDTYAKTLNDRANDVRASLGSIERSWMAVSKAAKFAWDAMLDVGREESGQKKINDLSASLVKMQELLASMPAGDRRRGLVENRIAEIREQMGALQDAYIKEQKAANQKMLAAQANQAAIDQDQELLQYRSNEQKRVAAINAEQGRAREAIYAAEATGDKDLAAKIAKNRDELIKQINEKYTKKAGASTAGASRSASLQGFTDDQTEERARISADTKVLQAEFQARQVSAEAYYSRMRELAEQNTSTDARTITSQIEYLRAQAVSGKDAINVNKQIGELEAKLAKVRIDGAAAQQTLTTQEKVAIESRNAGVRSYASALDASTDALQQQMDAMVAKVGIGDREYEIQERVNDVYREQAKRLTELSLQKTADPANAKAYDEEIAAVRAATETRVAIIRSGYQSMAEAQADWVNGAKSSWANYADDAQNIAGQSASLFDNLFGGMEDALVQFTTKGKVDFKSLANSIIADMARIAAKQAIVGALGSLFGGLGSGAGASGSTYIGQASTGAGSNYNFGSNVGQFTGGGWANGGYTGDGGKYDTAGYVHRGEYVINAESTRRIGRSYLDQLNGYANGGMVGGSGGPGLLSQPNVNITVHGAPSDPQVNVTQGQNGLDIDLAFGAIERRIAGGISDGSSMVGTSIKQRYGLREVV